MKDKDACRATDKTKVGSSIVVKKTMDKFGKTFRRIFSNHSSLTRVVRRIFSEKQKDDATHVSSIMHENAHGFVPLVDTWA